MRVRIRQLCAAKRVLPVPRAENVRPRRRRDSTAKKLPPGGGGGGERAPTQGHDGDGYEVFVKYLPHETSEEEVAVFFAEKFGALKGDARLIRDQNGRCKGAGFVTFASEASRAECLRNDGVRFGGRHLSVSVAKTGTFGVRATEQAPGTHTPAMLRETLDALVRADPRGVYVDGTFGRGGHSRGILSALAPEGRLHAFDMDPEVRDTFPPSFFFFFGTLSKLFRVGGFRFRFFFPLRRARVLRRTRRDENTTEPRKLFRMVNTRVATNISPIEIERRAEDGETRGARGAFFFFPRDATTARLSSAKRFFFLATRSRADSLRAFCFPFRPTPPGRVRLPPQAIAEGKKLESQDARFTIHHAPFGCMDKVLAPLGVRPAGVFLDLGISSPQFDDQGRGFRPEQDGPLDLRFDLTKGVPAYEFLQTVDRDELMRIVFEYGETSDPSAARRVADAVVVARESATLPSTTKASRRSWRRPRARSTRPYTPRSSRSRRSGST